MIFDAASVFGRADSIRVIDSDKKSVVDNDCMDASRCSLFNLKDVVAVAVLVGSVVDDDAFVVV